MKLLFAAALALAALESINAAGCDEADFGRMRFRRSSAYSRESRIAVFDSTAISNWKACSKKCREQSACLRFNYLMYYRTCELYSVEHDAKQRRTNLMYYSGYKLCCYAYKNRDGSCGCEGYVLDLDDTTCVVTCTDPNAAPDLVDGVCKCNAGYKEVDNACVPWEAWTSQSTTNVAWRSVTYSPTVEKFVAVGDGGNIMESDDGKLFNVVAANVDPDVGAPDTTHNWQRIVWGSTPARFCAVANAGDVANPAANDRSMYSLNGLDWTLTNAVANAFTGISYGNGWFIAAADTGTNRISRSQDCINWEERDVGNLDLRNLAYSSGLGRFVGMVFGSPYVITSDDDGDTWTTTVSNIASDWRGVAWSPTLNIFVAISVATFPNVVQVSPTGLAGSWTSYNTGVELQFFGITWSQGLGAFIAVGNSGGIMVSYNGTTWSRVQSPSTNRWVSVICNDEATVTCVAVSSVGSDGLNRAMSCVGGGCLEPL